MDINITKNILDTKLTMSPLSKITLVTVTNSGSFYRHLDSTNNKKFSTVTKLDNTIRVT